MIYNTSFYAHILNGLFLFIAILIIILNFGVFKRIDLVKACIVSLLLSIAVGVHGLSHLGLESVYGYNSLA